MHFVEQARDALDLIHDDPGPGLASSELVGKEPGLGKESLVATLVQKIDTMSLWVMRARPCALAPPRTPNRKNESRGGWIMRG